MEIEKQAAYILMNSHKCIVTEDLDGFFRVLFVQDNGHEILQSSCGGGSTVLDSNELADVRKWTLEKVENGPMMLRAWDFPGQLMWQGYVFGWVDETAGFVWVNENQIVRILNDLLAEQQ